MQIHGDHDSATILRTLRREPVKVIMMITTMNGDPHPSNPTVRIPPWDFPDPTVHVHPPNSHYDAAAFAALQRFLPSNAPDDEYFDGDYDFPADAFSGDDFRMFEFKVKRCARARSHDWTECPFAHPGEKARRRDPRRHHYSGSACPDFRRGACRKGDACEHAHGVFECWLHPARYRTQPCKDGIHCRRRICFFAHTPEQLRVLTGSPDGSPRISGPDPFVVFGSSPTSTLFISPPSSPTVTAGKSLDLSLQLSQMKMGPGLGPGFGSPRSPSRIRPGFMRIPTTPIRVVNRTGPSPFCVLGEEPAMERVESGKAMREKIYAKIGKDNSLDRVDPVAAAPDVGWVSELVK